MHFLQQAWSGGGGIAHFMEPIGFGVSRELSSSAHCMNLLLSELDEVLVENYGVSGMVIVSFAISFFRLFF